MKKILAIVLAAVCVLSFSACDSDNGSSESSTTTSTTTTSTTAESTTTTTTTKKQTTTTKKTTTTTTTTTPETMYTFDYLFNTDYLVMPDGITWNMNKRKVEQKDTRSSTDLDGGSGIVYAQMDKDYYSFSDSYVDYVYLYEDEKLKAYLVMLDEITDAYDPALYYDYYVTYRDIIKAKYGAWESQTITWNDEEYKNQKAMWNEAFGLGDFSIKTVWHLQNQTIVMDWSIDSMSTTFCTPEYESLL